MHMGYRMLLVEGYGVERKDSKSDFALCDDDCLTKNLQYFNCHHNVLVHRISLIMNAPKALSMLATSEPNAIGVPTRDTPWITNDVLLHPDGSTQEGAAFVNRAR